MDLHPSLLLVTPNPFIPAAADLEPSGKHC